MISLNLTKKYTAIIEKLFHLKMNKMNNRVVEERLGSMHVCKR